MLVIGVFQILVGIAAIVRDEFFVATANYLYVITVYGWGWVHLGLGALLVLTGIGLFTGVTWVRVIGVTLAALSAIANFLFIPYYPTWALLIIALDVALIWAMSTGRGRITADETPPAMAAGASTPERWTSANQNAMPTRTAIPAEPAEPERVRTGHATTDPPATA
jgi:hypothetical protein